VHSQCVKVDHALQRKVTASHALCENALQKFSLTNSNTTTPVTTPVPATCGATCTTDGETRRCTARERLEESLIRYSVFGLLTHCDFYVAILLAFQIRCVMPPLCPTPYAVSISFRCVFYIDLLGTLY